MNTLKEGQSIYFINVCTTVYNNARGMFIISTIEYDSNSKMCKNLIAQNNCFETIKQAEDALNTILKLLKDGK